MCVSTSINDILENAVKYLKNNGIEENTVLDAQLILAYVLQKDRIYLVVNKNRALDSDIVLKYQNLLKLRAEGLPLQYILGAQEFMSLPFSVTPEVLIPRGDTEALVEFVIEQYRNLQRDENIQIMDIGTGSGCIGISLAYYIPQSKVYAVDISQKALDIGKKNAQTNGVDGRIHFINKDILRGFPEQIHKDSLNAIVSNPPYIKTDIIDTLQREVKAYEPHLALDGGEDGLTFYRRIILEAYFYLKLGGWLVLEVGHDQSEEVSVLISDTGQYGDINIIKDLSGISRVVAAKRI